MHIRWMIRRDMPEVMAIEQAVFEHPWTEREFSDELRRRNSIGMVLERADEIHGYVVYRLNSRDLEILNLAVHPEHRRLMLGTALMDKLKAKLSPERRCRLTADVRESNLDAQLFFRELGFRAVAIKPRRFDNDEAAYRFQYRLKVADYREAEKIARAT